MGDPARNQLVAHPFNLAKTVRIIFLYFLTGLFGCINYGVCFVQKYVGVCCLNRTVTIMYIITEELYDPGYTLAYICYMYIMDSPHIFGLLCVFCH